MTVQLKLSESSLRTMPSLDCTFASCGTKVTNNSEAICIALYNAHIATHMAVGASGAVSKSRALPVIRPKIKAGISLVDWEVFESVFNLFKANTELCTNSWVAWIETCSNFSTERTTNWKGLLKKIYSS